MLTSRPALAVIAIVFAVTIAIAFLIHQAHAPRLAPQPPRTITIQLDTL